LCPQTGSQRQLFITGLLNDGRAGRFLLFQCAFNSDVWLRLGVIERGFCLIGQLFLVWNSRTGISQQACIYLRRKRVSAGQRLVRTEIVLAVWIWYSLKCIIH
jgi:hypothetical protein